MSENTTETRTVQQYRHEARRVLTQAREALAVRTEATKQVYTLLNGTIESVIAGRTGLSQEEQVRRLDEALGTVQGNKEALAEAVAAAKAEVQSIIDAWDTTFAEALDAAAATLTEGRDFARDRDFDAWQEEKRRKRSRGYYGGGYSETTSTEDDEDTDADDEGDD